MPNQPPEWAAKAPGQNCRHAEARHRTTAVSVSVFLVNVLNFYDRQALGAVIEPLRHEFHLTDQQLGAIPTAFVIVYALAGVPLGRLADRWSRKRLLAIGVSVWAALTALGGARPGTRCCCDAAGRRSRRGGMRAGGHELDRRHRAAARRSRALAGFMMAVPVGVMLSFVVERSGGAGVRVADGADLAAAPAVLLVPALLLLPEPSRRQDPCTIGDGRLAAAHSGVVVDHAFRRDGQLHAVQLLVLRRGVPDALPRDVGGAGGHLVGAGFGRGGHRGGAGRCGLRGATAIRGRRPRCWRLRWRGLRSGSRAARRMPRSRCSCWHMGCGRCTTVPYMRRSRTSCQRSSARPRCRCTSSRCTSAEALSVRCWSAA